MLVISEMILKHYKACIDEKVLKKVFQCVPSYPFFILKPSISIVLMKNAISSALSPSVNVSPRRTHFSLEFAYATTKEIVRGWIVGTTEPLFRGEERRIFEIKRLQWWHGVARRSTTSDETCIRSASTCTECTSSWICSSRKFHRFGPFERDLQQFSAAGGVGHTFVITLRIFNLRCSDARRRLQSILVLSTDLWYFDDNTCYDI